MGGNPFDWTENPTSCFPVKAGVMPGIPSQGHGPLLRCISLSEWSTKDYDYRKVGLNA